MKNWTRLQSILVKAAVLVLAVMVFTLFINLSWFDEELHPHLQLLKTPQRVSMDGNAYALLWGLPAAADKDALAVGQAIVSRMRALYEQNEKIEVTADELSAFFGGDAALDADWQAQYKSLSCNSRLEIGCAKLWLADVEHTGVGSDRLQVVFRRYERMLSQPHFRENQEADVFTPLPPYGLLMNVARVYLSDKALDPNADEFIQAANRDLAFWLTMLKEGDYLIAKMVALAGIRNNLQIVSTLIHNNRFTPAELSQLQTIIKPFTEEERNIGETFLAEMRLNLIGWESQSLPYGDPPWLTRLFMQENASLNEIYTAIMIPVQLLSSLTPVEFYQQQGFEKQPIHVRVFPPHLYNLGGQLYLKDTVANYSVQDYVTRVHDVNGQIGTVLLQIEIALHPEKETETIIQQSRYRNPYTRAAMKFDAQKKILGFDCLAKNSKDVCKVQL